MQHKKKLSGTGMRNGACACTGRSFTESSRDIVNTYGRSRSCGGCWTFVFLHKPAWEKEGEETFAAIESALGERPYTVFYGHTHVYGYSERNGRDYINLATTGGEQKPDKGRSMDHLTLVTFDGSEVSIAILLTEGILDKTGHIPLNGDELQFENRGTQGSGSRSRSREDST